MAILKNLVKILRNLRNELLALSWTLGGTGLVLITLSGETLKWGLWISGASLFCHLLGALLFKPDD
jgi:hypothetical protein